MLKNTFKMIAKSVLLRPQGLRPKARAPTCPPPPCYATDEIIENIQFV